MTLFLHWWHIGLVVMAIGVIFVMCGKVEPDRFFAVPNRTMSIGLVIVAFSCLYFAIGAFVRLFA